MIAFNNSIIKNAKKRNEINQRIEKNTFCFEMKTANIINSYFCLIIRKICDKIFSILSTIFCKERAT